MATPNQDSLPNADLVGKQRRAILQSLAQRPHGFEFFQAVRLLTRIALSNSDDFEESARPVGHDYAPQSELVRFRSLPSHTFPGAEIHSFDASQSETVSGRPRPAEMTISFLGLTGPVGALPQHYTQTVIDRIRYKDHALRDFLDLFNHRAVSLFYRAWEKHRVLPLMERAEAERRDDPFTRVLFSFVGLGSPGLRNRLDASDATFVYYSGLYSHYPRNAQSLERLIAEIYGLPAAVLQFVGQWLRLETDEQTSLPSDALLGGRNCRLGVESIAGQRVWTVESKFRIRLGPMGHEAFQRMLPDSCLLTQLAQVVRTYAGPELDFDVQLVLRRDEVPECQLSDAESGGPRLGWNTWACSVAKATDAEDAVFEVEGRPTN